MTTLYDQSSALQLCFTLLCLPQQHSHAVYASLSFYMGHRSHQRSESVNALLITPTAMEAEGEGLSLV